MQTLPHKLLISNLTKKMTRTGGISQDFSVRFYRLRGAGGHTPSFPTPCSGPARITSPAMPSFQSVWEVSSGAGLPTALQRVSPEEVALCSTTSAMEQCMLTPTLVSVWSFLPPETLAICWDAEKDCSGLKGHHSAFARTNIPICCGN